MQEKSTRAKKKPECATMAGDDAALDRLAADFLDLWQANLMAWASDPLLAPALPQAAQQPEKPIGKAGDDR